MEDSNAQPSEGANKTEDAPMNNEEKTADQ